MGEEESSTPGDHHRDLPAWGYLLVGVLFTGAGVWLIASGAMADSRRLLVPWFMVAVGLVAVGAGVREWSRNGSATARRRRSAAELEQEARQADRARTWRWVRVVGTLLVAGIVLGVALLG
jgi:hypothetical protein